MKSLFRGLLLVCLFGAASAQAQLIDKKALSLAEARKAVVAATAEAKKNNWNMVIAVVDDAGLLLTLDRLDNTQRASVDIATGKARTAVMFKRPSAMMEESITKGRTALLSMAAATGCVFVQGGMPIVVKGEVIGAVGVSGGNSQQDEQVATAGVGAIGQ